MKTNKHKKFFLSFLTFIVLCLFFFIPRYFANKIHDPIEDEFLSIMFSRDVCLKDLLFQSPDYTHPGWWYALMKVPILLFGIENNLFLYRYIQVLILFSCLAFSFFYFKKKLPIKFLFAFLILFLSNIYLVHLSIQYRMFSMLMGVATIYSFFWFELIKNKKALSYGSTIFLSLIAILGFFTDYSMLWIIPLWPLIYLLLQKESKNFKKILLFTLIFLLGIVWFIPIFFANIQKSFSDVGWLLPHTAKNTISLILNLFGFFPLTDHNKLNFLFFPYLALLSPMILEIFKKKSFSYLKLILIGSSLMFIFFLVVNQFVNNRLFYVRAILPIIIVVYILIADFFSSYAKKIIFEITFFGLILLSFGQFAVYFFHNTAQFQKYVYFNDQKHPISYFKNIEFPSNSCLFTIPYWNSTSARYFLYPKVKLITTEALIDGTNLQESNCDNIYFLDQTSIERYRVEYAYEIIQQADYDIEFLARNSNQNLYFLKKQR